MLTSRIRLRWVLLAAVLPGGPPWVAAAPLHAGANWLLPPLEAWREDVAMPEPVELADALEVLRVELEEAWAAGQGRSVRFRVSEVTLTVQAVARKENKAGGKVRWWLVEGGADHASTREGTQTLVLTLSPQLYDEVGTAGPLDVSGSQPTPGD